MDAADSFSRENGLNTNLKSEECYYLGLALYQGLFGERNYAEAAKWFGMVKGDYKYQWRGESVWTEMFRSAQYYLGFMYYYGQGVTQDYDSAIKCFRRATPSDISDNGYGYNEQAICMLGIAYEEGNGVAQDFATAAAWYRLAAGKADSNDTTHYFSPGCAEAQNRLADAYRNGKGVENDPGNALFWYRKAAEQGHAAAQNSLADMYATGEGTEQDLGEAMKWCIKSAQQGNADAKNKLIKLINRIPVEGANLLQP